MASETLDGLVQLIGKRDACLHSEGRGEETPGADLDVARCRNEMTDCLVEKIQINGWKRIVASRRMTLLFSQRAGGGNVRV